MEALRAKAQVMAALHLEWEAPLPQGWMTAQKLNMDCGDGTPTASHQHQQKKRAKADGYTPILPPDP